MRAATAATASQTPAMTARAGCGDALAAATGPDFDTMWLEMMIEHHQGAVSMAEDVKASGTNPTPQCSPIRSSPPSRPRSTR
jgi:uncharacterized protein (DUF305 family)